MVTAKTALNIIPVERNSELIAQVNQLAKKIYLPYYSNCINPVHAFQTYNNYQTPDAIKKAILSGEEYYIVCSENLNVGYFAVKVNKKENSLFISKLYLDYSVRGKGFGKYILNLILNFASKIQLSQIELMVSKKNPTIKIYEKFGFKILKLICMEEGNNCISEDYLMRLKI